MNHGRYVKAILKNMVENKFVTVKLLKNEKSYNRYLGNVYCNGVNINKYLVRKGHSISAYRKDYKEIENMAILENVGMWGYDKKIDPRNWRKYNNSEKQNIINNLKEQYGYEYKTWI